MRIKKNDFVKVIAGKYKGKVGKVLKVFPEDNKIIVEGVNIFKRHRRKNKNLDNAGGIVEFNAPINVSNVAFYDKEKEKICKLGYKIFGDEKWRIDKKTSDKIDIIKKEKK